MLVAVGAPKPGFEQLESRCFLAIDITLTGTQGSFVDNGSEIYPLSLSVNEVGQLQYNLRTVVDGTRLFNYLSKTFRFEM